jgi:predicted transposase YdaD
VELLAYLTALVYHFRNERASLREELERSIKQAPEIRAVGRTIAEALREEGKREGRREGRREGKQEGVVEAKQQTLVLLLRRKFGRKLTTAVTGVIQATRDLPTLDEWLGNVLDADTLEEVGIPGRS